MRNARWAFTIIELLLVIAVIILLAAMILPMFSKAREAGRSTRCVSNLHQLQIAVMNCAGVGSLPDRVSWIETMRDPYTGQILGYKHHAGWVGYWNHTNGETHQANDFKEKYGWTANDHGVASITNGALWGYARDKGIYLCPTYSIKCKKAVRSYSMDVGVFTNTIEGGGATVIPLFSDDATLMSASDSPDGEQSPTADGQITPAEVWRGHLDKANVVFLDGHLEKW